MKLLSAAFVLSCFSSARGCSRNAFGECDGACGGGRTCQEFGVDCECTGGDLDEQGCHEDADGGCSGLCSSGSKGSGKGTSEESSACVAVPVPEPDRRHGDRCKCVALDKDGLLPFWTETFNALPTIHEAQVRKLEAGEAAVSASTTAMARLLVEAGVGNFTGVALKHKHFDLSEGERVVEIVGEVATVTVPLLLSTVAEDAQPCLRPYLFAVDDSGFAVPLEYAVCAPLLDARYAQFVKAVPTLFPALRDAGLNAGSAAGLFAVAIRHRDSVADASPTHHTLEVGPRDGRWLVVQPGTAEDKGSRAANMTLIETFWTASQLTAGANDTPAVGWCGHDCQHACGGH